MVAHLVKSVSVYKNQCFYATKHKDIVNQICQDIGKGFTSLLSDPIRNINTVSFPNVGYTLLIFS